MISAKAATNATIDTQATHPTRQFLELEQAPKSIMAQNKNGEQTLMIPYVNRKAGSFGFQGQTSLASFRYMPPTISAQRPKIPPMH